MNKVELVTKDENDDKYLPQNSSLEKRVGRIQNDILYIAEGMDPWQIEFCRRYANGEAKTKLAKELKKADKTINKFLETTKAQLLVQYYKLLTDVESGPSEAVRKNMLYEIAVDNQKLDPKESIKAIGELNKMDSNKNQGGGMGNITINIADTLSKGALDA